MIIDIIFVLLIAFAIIKGASRGFIVSIFSFLAVIIGVAAAMKLSYIVANWLQHSINTGKEWLPFIAFIVVLVGVIILVRFIANVIQRGIKLAMLGWLNRLGGVILFVVLYLTIYSIVLFYLTEMNILKPKTITASHTYSLIEPFGTKAVDLVGKIIPVFKNMFQQLSDFFANIAQKHS